MYICIRTYVTYIMCVCMYVRVVCMCASRETYAYGAPCMRDEGSQLAHSSGRSGRKCCCAEAGRLPPLFVCELSAGVLLAPRNNITISIRATVAATATGFDDANYQKIPYSKIRRAKKNFIQNRP